MLKRRKYSFENYLLQFVHYQVHLEAEGEEEALGVEVEEAVEEVSHVKNGVTIRYRLSNSEY